MTLQRVLLGALVGFLATPSFTQAEPINHDWDWFKTKTITVTDTKTLSPTCTIASTTTAPTSTPTSCPTSCPAPPTCNNMGFDWAYYNNSARNTDTSYSTFHPDTFKTIAPIYIGSSSYVGGLYGSQGEQQGGIYDVNRNFNFNFFALNQRAYLYACEGGIYRFSIPYANDAVFLWTGAEAYSGWTDENADARARYNQPDHIPGSAAFELEIPAETYVPIRFVYGQAQYGGGFTFTVTTPSGEVIVSNEETFSPYVVRYSCDRTTAPAFPAYGSEP